MPSNALRCDDVIISSGTDMLGFHIQLSEVNLLDGTYFRSQKAFISILSKTTVFTDHQPTLLQTISF